MTLKSKKIGRPLKAAPPGTRQSLGLKVTAETKQRLDDAARASGRTQSQEAEARLVRSFDRQDLLGEVLSLAYGREAAGLLMMIGRAMSDAGRTAGTIAGGTALAAQDWMASPHAYEQAVRAARAVLEAMRPGPAPTAPAATLETGDARLDALLASAVANAGLGVARGVIDAVRGHGVTSALQAEGDDIRRLLGAVADRLDVNQGGDNGKD